MRLAIGVIPHNCPTLGPEEQSAAARVLASGWVAQGREVEAFENELCQFLGLPGGHAVAVSSGSAALTLALLSLDAKGKRIGLPVYSCAALRNAIGIAGGESVYLDCREGGVNVDTSAAFRSGVDILIAPSMFGIPVELPDASDCMLIEDLAQSLGASIGDRRIGLRGEVGVCSFYATKLMTSGGQGGAVISRDKARIDWVRDYREFDCRRDRKLRFNFQLTDLQGAIGRVQLRRLPEFIKRREEWFALYRHAELDLLDCRTVEVRPVRYRIVMRCDQPARLISALASEGVRAIVPIEQYELLDEPARYPVALALTKTTVSLPAHPGLREEDVVRIANIAKQAA
jgi:perosamine synthetase